jgi:hypothetical protein
MHIRRSSQNSLLLLFYFLFAFSCMNNNKNDEIVESYSNKEKYRLFYENGNIKYIELQKNGNRTDYFYSLYENGQYETIGFEIDSGTWSILNYDLNYQLIRHFLVINDTIVYEKKIHNDGTIEFISRKVTIVCKQDTCMLGDTVKYVIKGSGIIGFNEQIVGYVKEVKKYSSKSHDYQRIGTGLNIESKFIPKDTGLFEISGDLTTYIDSSFNTGYSNEFIHDIVVIPPNYP